jgi:glucose-1-phosphate thymidylyltransferase
VEPGLIEDLRTRFTATGDACIGVTSVADPSQYGVVTTEGDRVVEIREKPPAHSVSSNVVNVGVYAFGPEIFAAIRRTNTFGELALTDTLAEYIDDHPLRAVRYSGPWHELSFPWDLLTLNAKHRSDSVVDVDESAVIHDDATVAAPAVVGAQSVIQPGARVLQDTALGRNVSIGANAVVTNSVVLDDATIQAGAVVSDSIVGSGAVVGQSSSLVGGESDIVRHGEVFTDVQFGCLLGDRTSLGGNVFVNAGCIVGNGVMVESGASVDHHVPNDAYVSRG